MDLQASLWKFFSLTPNKDLNTSGSARQKYGRSEEEQRNDKFNSKPNIHINEIIEIQTTTMGCIMSNQGKWNISEYSSHNGYTIHLVLSSYCRAEIHHSNTNQSLKWHVNSSIHRVYHM